MLKIRDDIKNEVNIEKITNIPFDDIIGHSECSRKFFTIENNDIIYRRLNEETNIDYLPYLGPCIDFGIGNICLEEGNNIFKFYIIDRSSKFDYQEFTDIKDAINCLVDFYRINECVDNPETMKKIFFDTLHLEEQEIKKLIK